MNISLGKMHMTQNPKKQTGKKLVISYPVFIEEVLSEKITRHIFIFLIKLKDSIVQS